MSVAEAIVMGLMVGVVLGSGVAAAVSGWQLYRMRVNK